MKKIIGIGLLSLGLAVPAHAFIAAILTGGVGGVALAAAGGVVLSGSYVRPGENSIMTKKDASSLLLEAGQEGYAEGNSMAELDVYADIDALMSVGFYSVNEGEALKAEFALGHEFSIDVSEIKGITSDEVVALIQERAGCSESLANYFASKMGL